MEISEKMKKVCPLGWVEMDSHKMSLIQELASINHIETVSFMKYYCAKVRR